METATPPPHEFTLEDLNIEAITDPKILKAIRKSDLNALVNCARGEFPSHWIPETKEYNIAMFRARIDAINRLLEGSRT